jgi:hypothetical protein
MIYPVSSLVREIRIALDENMTSGTLSALGDIDTLSLSEIIESKIEDAARIVETNAPLYMLDGGQTFLSTACVTWESAHGYGMGSIVLPDDFMRLISFQMSDWDYPVAVAITEDSPLYIQQRSRFAGIRGCPQRPVVAIVSHPSGQMLEFYSCTGGSSVEVKRARYLPIPHIQNGKIDLCEKLERAVVYYAAYLVALAIGSESAAALKSVSDTLIDKNE